jgi:festuclavine dehydrogenase
MPDTAQKPTVLVLGGRGRTATPIASLLHAANIPFLVASPSTSPDSPFRQVIFDWWDEKTYENAWIKASQEGLKPISNIWLAGTGTFDIGPAMIKFVEFASSKGVNKFVLLSATTLEKGGPIMGEVHEHLDSTPGIEYAVLRPTWFMGT